MYRSTHYKTVTMVSKSLFLISVILASAAAQWQNCNIKSYGSLSGTAIPFDGINIVGGEIRLNFANPCGRLGVYALETGLLVRACADGEIPTVIVPDLEHATIDTVQGAAVYGTAYCRQGVAASA